MSADAIARIAHYAYLEAVRGPEPVDSEVPWEHYSERMKAPWLAVASALSADAQLAADVRTLNEWAASVLGGAHQTIYNDNGPQGWTCWVSYDKGDGGRWTECELHGPTPEAAIHAAAEAVRKGEV